MADYTKYTDKELVDLVIAIPHNEEAAYFIIADRYRGLIFNVYKIYFGNSPEWFDDCLDELFISLRGAKGDWMSLSKFEWRCNLRTWLIRVSKNKFLECYNRLIEKMCNDTSLFTGEVQEKKPSSFQDDYDRQQLLIELMETIGQLKDEDQKFCILKKLQGYNSKETAILLKKKWDKNGTIIYNNKGEIVIPSEGYVNVRIQRATENLRKMMLGR